MVDIRGLMKQSCNYPLGKKSTSWLMEVLESSNDEISVIVPEHYFNMSFWKPIIDRIKEKYNIGVMCQLGNIYLNTNVKMVLVQFVTKDIDDVKISLFSGVTYNVKSNRTYKKTEIRLADTYTVAYEKYIDALESWINNDLIIESMTDIEVKTISVRDIKNGILYPQYYSDKAIKVRRHLEQEDIIPLEEVAEIIRPHKRSLLGKCLSFSDMKYPFNASAVEEREVTDVKLQKGDIIVPIIDIGFNSPFLYQGSEVAVYASSNMFVIRCYDILPEYVYLYLMSETARITFESVSMGEVLQRINIKTIKKFPIIKPSLASQKYIDDFNFLTANVGRVYNKKQSEVLQEYIKQVSNIRDNLKETKNVEDILNLELANTIKVHNEEQLRSFLVDDLKELNACYKVEAFKATLVLAGSILEAVLIDWLSEINGIDYFENDFMVKDKNGKEVKANLYNYINEIKYIERPHWMEEASKAHEIRKKRNAVHAKLCLKEDVVNKKVCQEVIGYLEDVLKTRGVR